MIRTYLASPNPPAPHQPGERPRGAPTDPRDPSGQAFVAEWLAHVAAGRVGNPPPVNEEARAIVRANERLICGDGTLGIW